MKRMTVEEALEVLHKNSGNAEVHRLAKAYVMLLQTVELQAQNMKTALESLERSRERLSGE